ncbi:MAG TPA: hypothetical protein VMN36_00245 [Verrucomicrobiales bacterium]|nr:hypothetical protein [Verrucomicrobiales bacterium]
MITTQQISPHPVRRDLPERIETPLPREEALQSAADRLAGEVQDPARAKRYLASSAVPAGGE